MYSTSVISTGEEFAAVRGEWERLLARSATNTVFQTWEWLYSWWEVHGAGSALQILCVRGSGGDLVGLAPLLRRSGRYYRFPVREVAFLGEGYSDQHDLIVAPGDGEAVAGLLAALHALGGWDIARFERLGETSLLHGAGPLLGRTGAEACSASPYLRLEGTWEEYLATLSCKFRQNIRSRLKKLGAEGPWEFREETSPAAVDGIVDEMVGIDARSRKSDATRAFYQRPGAEAFMRRFLGFAAEAGWMHYTALVLGGRAIAYALGFVYRRQYHGYNTSFLEECADLSPGKLVINHTIQRCFENRAEVDEYDFSPGETFIKSLWTSQRREQRRLVVFGDGPYPWLLRRTVFGLRPWVKERLPRVAALAAARE